jgi:hypothetical protein
MLVARHGRTRVFGGRTWAGTQPAPTRTQRLLLGDWSRVVRDPIDLLRLALVVAAAVALVRQVDAGSVTLAACAAAGLAVRPLLLPRLYDLMVLVALAVQGLTEVSGAYDPVPWIDRVVHFVVPMLGSGVFYVALARLDVLPDPRDDTGPRHLFGIGLVTFALGAAFGAVWELVEWVSDGLFGSALQEGNEDTVGDLAMDSPGALVGAVLLFVWTVFGWGSVRRVPGTHREAHD